MNSINFVSEFPCIPSGTWGEPEPIKVIPKEYGDKELFEQTVHWLGSPKRVMEIEDNPDVNEVLDEIEKEEKARVCAADKVAFIEDEALSELTEDWIYDATQARYDVGKCTAPLSFYSLNPLTILEIMKMIKHSAKKGKNSISLEFDINSLEAVKEVIEGYLRDLEILKSGGYTISHTPIYSNNQIKYKTIIGWE